MSVATASSAESAAATGTSLADGSSCTAASGCKICSSALLSRPVCTGFCPAAELPATSSELSVSAGPGASSSCSICSVACVFAAPGRFSEPGKTLADNSAGTVSGAVSGPLPATVAGCNGGESLACSSAAGSLRTVFAGPSAEPVISSNCVICGYQRG